MSFDAKPDPVRPTSDGAMRAPRFSRLQRGAMAGGLAFGLAVGGAGIAFAASSSTPTTTPSPVPPGHGAHGFKGGDFKGGGFKGALGRVVHGQFTIRTKSGGYQTVLVQVGKAQAVSPTSISVTSTDGYSHTYVVMPSTIVDAQRDGISSVARLDQVRLIATQGGSKDTATNITDMTKLQSSRADFGFGANRPENAPGAGVDPAA